MRVNIGTALKELEALKSCILNISTKTCKTCECGIHNNADKFICSKGVQAQRTSLANPPEFGCLY